MKIYNNSIHTFFVVKPEGFPQLFLHGFSIFLNDELGSKGDEFLEFKATGLYQTNQQLIQLHTFFNSKTTSILTISVDFFDEFFEDFLVEGLTHQTQNVGDHVAWNAA